MSSCEAFVYRAGASIDLGNRKRLLCTFLVRYGASFRFLVRGIFIELPPKASFMRQNASIRRRLGFEPTFCLKTGLFRHLLKHFGDLNREA